MDESVVTTAPPEPESALPEPPKAPESKAGPAGPVGPKGEPGSPGRIPTSWWLWPAILGMVLVAFLAYLAWNGRSTPSVNQTQDVRVEGNQPPVPTYQPVPEQPTTVNSPPATPVHPASECTATTGDGYALVSEATEVSTHPEDGWFLHVQFWVDGTQDSPEMETVLDFGRYAIREPDGDVLGHVWEYGPRCTRSQVEAEMDKSIARRQANNANTVGRAPQDLVEKYFHKVGP